LFHGFTFASFELRMMAAAFRWSAADIRANRSMSASDAEAGSNALHGFREPGGNISNHFLPHAASANLSRLSPSEDSIPPMKRFVNAVIGRFRAHGSRSIVMATRARSPLCELVLPSGRP